MAQAFYRARFTKQLTGTELGAVNCNSASGAMLVNQATLGLKNPSADAFRRATGDIVGGVNIATVGDTCEHDYGVGVTVYDASDGFTFDRLVADLKRGKFAVVNGDYDQVPHSLAGSKTFDGLHSEFWHRVTSSGIVVGDPLCDGRALPGGGHAPLGFVTYPMSVARNYVEKLDRQIPGNSIHAATMDLKRLKSRSGSAVNVRATATRGNNILGRISGTTKLVWGGTVRGESIGGNSVWYRVWFPARASLAYVHSSVVVRV